MIMVGPRLPWLALGARHKPNPPTSINTNAPSNKITTSNTLDVISGAQKYGQ